jgi:hypothetical protein
MHIEIDEADCDNAQHVIVNIIADDILKHVHEQVRLQKIYAFGTYENSWVKYENVRIRGHIPVGGLRNLPPELYYRKSGKTEMTVENTAPYSGLYEWGHTPYAPPVEPIIKWCERVKGESHEEAVKSGYRIVNYYKTHFFKPHYVLTKSVINTMTQLGGL